MVSKPESLRARKMVLVEFAGITMSVPKTSRAQFRKNVADGARALAQLPGILSKPGVKLALPPDVPRYVADRRDPRLVVQTICGVSRRGHFDRDGSFIEVNE